MGLCRQLVKQADRRQRTEVAGKKINALLNGVLCCLTGHEKFPPPLLFTESIHPWIATFDKPLPGESATDSQQFTYVSPLLQQSREKYKK
jgi:hypothetical protein